MITFNNKQELLDYVFKELDKYHKRYYDIWIAFFGSSIHIQAYGSIILMTIDGITEDVGEKFIKRLFERYVVHGNPLLMKLMSESIGMFYVKLYNKNPITLMRKIVEKSLYEIVRKAYLSTSGRLNDFFWKLMVIPRKIVQNVEVK